MNLDDNLENIKKLLEYTKMAIESVDNDYEKILSEIKHWNLQININELKSGLQLILERANNWFERYKNSKDILCIGLKDYDTVSKEASYILGECALIDELYSEIIDWQVSCIGRAMCNEIRKGGKAHK